MRSSRTGSTLSEEKEEVIVHINSVCLGIGINYLGSRDNIFKKAIRSRSRNSMFISEITSDNM